ncbi:MAG: hypothetical protein HFJ24_04335 [Clostridia bacterium]|nr:hypothetical protein [Clostridia bacterium]MCI9275219.1 hypothetical protein [Clostridia bacterium]
MCFYHLSLYGTVLGIISKISDKVQIDKMAKFFKSSVVWILGFALTIFVRCTFFRRNPDKLRRWTYCKNYKSCSD